MIIHYKLVIPAPEDLVEVPANVTDLDLSSNYLRNITPEQLGAFCSALINCHNLRYIDLTGNSLGRLHLEQIQPFYDALTHCSNLQNINLSNNYLGNKSSSPAQWQSFCDALAGILNLRYLNLRVNFLRDLNLEQWQIFCDTIAKLTRLQSINFQYNGLSGLSKKHLKALGDAFASCPNLQHIDVQNNPGITRNTFTKQQWQALLDNMLTRCHNLRGISALELSCSNTQQMKAIYTSPKNTLIVGRNLTIMFKDEYPLWNINRRILLNWYASIIQFLQAVPIDGVGEIIIDYAMVSIIDKRIIIGMIKDVQEQTIKLVTFEQYEKIKVEHKPCDNIIRYQPHHLIWSNLSAKKHATSPRAHNQTSDKHKKCRICKLM